MHPMTRSIMIVGMMMKLGMISFKTSRIFVLVLVCMCGIERTSSSFCRVS